MPEILCNPIFALLLVASAILFATIVRRLPFGHALAAGSSPSRTITLDGFRGILAICVFVHHSSITYGVALGRGWQPPESSLLAFLGGGSVGFFFMATGFLFWRKALKAGGVVDPRPLLVSRVRRLLPMYLASYLAIIALIACASHFQLQQPIPQLIGSFSLGLFGGLFGTPGVNGFDPAFFNAGVMWTLRYEWLFTLASPALAFALIRLRFFPLTLAIPVAAFLFPGNSILHHLLEFLAGIFTAWVFARRSDVAGWMSRPGFGVVSIAVCGWTAFHCRGMNPVAMVLGMLPLFASVVSGFRMGGLLTLPGTQVLGRISYSIYLMHGIVLHLGLWALSRLVDVGTLSPLAFWFFCVALLAIIVSVCAVTFLRIEAPFITPEKVRQTESARSISGTASATESAGTTGPSRRAG